MTRGFIGERRSDSPRRNAGIYSLSYAVALVCLALGMVLFAHPVMAGGRVALIIANSAYRSVARLPNPPRDAALVAHALRASGFTSVDVANDLDSAGMDRALRAFGMRARGADLALVYYAGHGIEVGGRNFLIPIDARLETANDLDLEATPLDMVMRVVQGAALRVVLLDACRQNPFTRMQVADQGRSIGRGLSRVEPPEQTLVMYAAREGTIAADGQIGNSPFANALAQRIVVPGVPLNRVFRQVRDDVIRNTQSQQQPVIYDQTSAEDYYLVAPTMTPLAGPVAGKQDSASTRSPHVARFTTTFPLILQPVGAEADLRARITPAAITSGIDYLAQFPNGPGAADARDAIWLAATADRKGPAKPSPIAPDTWLSTDDNEFIKRRDKAAADLQWVLDVSEYGLVTDCHLTSQSGNIATVDERICVRIRQQARLLPALDEAGRPASGYFVWIYTLPDSGFKFT